MIFGSSISAREISSSFFCPPERFFAGEEGAPQGLAALLRAGEQHVLEHRELAELARDLEGAHQADARALVGAQAEDAAAFEDHVARLRREQPAEHVEERGFTGAVRTDDAGDALARDLERAAGERFEAAEGLGEGACGQHRDRARIFYATFWAEGAVAAARLARSISSRILRQRSSALSERR